MTLRAATVGLVAVATIGAAWWLLPEAPPGSRPGPALSGAAPVAGPAGVPLPVRTAEPRNAPAAAGTAGSSAVAMPAPAEAPRFDVARVGARGMLVTAGHAMPGAEVVLSAGGRELGRARADARGEWVILLAEALAPGARELVLAARSPGGGLVPARETLLLVVPESVAAAQAGAGQPAGSQSSATRRLPAGAGDGRDATPAAAETEEHRETGQATPGPLALLLPDGRAGGPPRVLQGAGGSPDGAARQHLGLDAVDYEDGGVMRFAGTAPPGATVRVYVGPDHAGDSVADAAGHWQLTPPAQPSLGRHVLRLDQLAFSGRVAARIEVPFQRDRLPEAALAAGEVVVQPGQSLWRIARRAYGTGLRYTVIYQANRDQLREPGRIHPGQVLAVPGQASGRTPGEAPGAIPGEIAGQRGPPQVPGRPR